MGGPSPGPNERRREPTEAEVRHAVDDLERAPRIIPARIWPGGLDQLDEPGLYAWWVDENGAHDLSEGLYGHVAASRVYAGQAGATRWPSGTMGAATLRSRIASQHLGGNIYGSTFRFTLAAALAEPLRLAGTGGKRLAGDGEAVLSGWIVDHLSLAVHPSPIATRSADWSIGS
jgi:hypothetical protein